MKTTVKELLQQRKLIFNEADYNYYRRKVVAGKGKVNIFIAALTITEMFQLNNIN